MDLFLVSGYSWVMGDGSVCFFSHLCRSPNDESLESCLYQTKFIHYNVHSIFCQWSSWQLDRIGEFIQLFTDIILLGFFFAMQNLKQPILCFLSMRMTRSLYPSPCFLRISHFSLVRELWSSSSQCLEALYHSRLLKIGFLGCSGFLQWSTPSKRLHGVFWTDTYFWGSTNSRTRYSLRCEQKYCMFDWILYFMYYWLGACTFKAERSSLIRCNLGANLKSKY